MNLNQFAKESGVIFFRYKRDYDGSWGYKTEDSPTISMMGYKTKKEARMGWLQDTFGEKTAKTLLKLLTKPKKSL